MRHPTINQLLLGLAGLVASFTVSAQVPAPDCAAIKEANPTAGDGTYIISPGGKTFAVHCHDMAGNPREYLTLANTGPGANYAAFGGEHGGVVERVTTAYTRVRLDPATLLVNVADQTFSSSAGADCCIGPTTIVAMPYAHASACRGDYWDAGDANVDLTGTPFTVDDVFTLRGWNPLGSANGNYQWWDGAVFPVQSQVVNLTGGGFCGGIGPTIDGGVFNQHGGFDLQLAFTGSLLTVDKDSCKNGGWSAYGVFKNQGDCVSYFATGGRNTPN